MKKSKAQRADRKAKTREEEESVPNPNGRLAITFEPLNQGPSKGRELKHVIAHRCTECKAYYPRVGPEEVRILDDILEGEGDESELYIALQNVYRCQPGRLTVGDKCIVVPEAQVEGYCTACEILRKATEILGRELPKIDNLFGSSVLPRELTRSTSGLPLVTPSRNLDPTGESGKARATLYTTVTSTAGTKASEMASSSRQSSVTELSSNLSQGTERKF